MKLLIETTGNFGLLHAEQDEFVRPVGFTVVLASQWANERVSLGQLLTKAALNDEATDEEWRETVRESDGDLELAVASFVDRFPADAASARTPEPAPSIPSTTQSRHNETKASGTHAPKPGRNPRPT